MCGSADLTDVLDVTTQQRAHRAIEVVLLGGLGQLGRDLQRDPAGSGDPCRSVDTLVRAHPAEERRVAALA